MTVVDDVDKLIKQFQPALGEFLKGNPEPNKEVFPHPKDVTLAIVRQRDDERAGMPMLPVIGGEEETRKQILLYTAVLVVVSLLLPALHLAGSLCLFSALALGLGLLHAAWGVWRVSGNSVAYLLFIFIALMIDSIQRQD